MLILRQLYALCRLRWIMVRSRPARAGLLALAAALPLLGALAVSAGRTLPPGSDLTVVTPALFASVALFAVLAPLAAGGGNELCPGDQLVGYPVRPGTLVAASLLLTPLNLAWLAQVLALLGVTGFITGSGPRLALAVLTALAYLALVSVAGQALAWLVVGIRTRRAGRLTVAGAAAAGVAAAWAVVATDRTAAALGALPTSWAVTLVQDGYSGPLGPWATGLAVLVLGTAVAGAAAGRACSWALSRPPDLLAGGEGRAVRRRRSRNGIFAELVAVDRASVLRSVPLRRGIAVLALTPGLAAALTAVEWPSIVMLPGLVAAGAGLLFGVNVFCLDGGGATWLASLPHDPRLAYLAKARVLAEVCAGTALVSVLLAATRAPDPPTAVELAAVAGSLLACTAVVVASCMAISVRHPHRAELRSARDTPAPPGSMVGYSLRLSLAATTTAAVASALSFAGRGPWLPLLGVAPIVALCLWSLLRGARRWRQPLPRAGVVAAVSAG